MRVSNKPVWITFLNEASDYIKGLTDMNGKQMIRTQKKTGFLGFLVAIESCQGIFVQWIEAQNAPLKYLLTYKLS